MKKLNLSRPYFLTISVSIAVSTVFLVVIFRITDWAQISRLWSNFKLGYLPQIFVSYVVSYIFRSWRWKVFDIDHKMHFWSLLHVTSIHTMFNNLLPARLGELAFPWLQKKLFQVSYVQSMSMFLISRIMDIVALGLTFGGGCILILGGGDQNAFKWLGLGIASILTLLLFLFAPLTTYAATIISPFLRSRKPQIAARLDEVQQTIRHLSVSLRLGIGLVLTLLICLSRYAFYWLMLLGLDIDISIARTIVGAGFTEFTYVIPVHGVAGFGTVEGGWTAGFKLAGLSVEKAAASGLIVHVTFLALSIILGLLALSSVLIFDNNKSR